jgi:hypothetical protein
MARTRLKQPTPLALLLVELRQQIIFFEQITNAGVLREKHTVNFFKLN